MQNKKKGIWFLLCEMNKCPAFIPVTFLNTLLWKKKTSLFFFSVYIHCSGDLIEDPKYTPRHFYSVWVFGGILLPTEWVSFSEVITITVKLLKLLFTLVNAHPPQETILVLNIHCCGAWRRDPWLGTASQWRSADPLWSDWDPAPWNLTFHRREPKSPRTWARRGGRRASSEGTAGNATWVWSLSPAVERCGGRPERGCGPWGRAACAESGRPGEQKQSRVERMRESTY